MKAKIVLCLVILMITFGSFACSGSGSSTTSAAAEATPIQTSISSVSPPSTTAITTTTPIKVEVQYIDLTPDQLYDLVLISSLTKVQADNNWKDLVGKWVKWDGEVNDVLDNNIVMVYLDVTTVNNMSWTLVASVAFEPSESNGLSQLNKEQKISFSARLVGKVTSKENHYNDSKYMGVWSGVELDHARLITK